MKKTMRNLVTCALFAFGACAFTSAAWAAAQASIYEIRPVDENGMVIDAPTAPIGAGETIRFTVRLAAPTLAGNVGGNPFRLVHLPGLNTEAVDWATGRRPAIGVFVNGKMILATLESSPTLRNPYLSDYVFAYTVKAGDFALPIRLASSDMKLVTDQGSSVTYYMDMGTGGTGVPAWNIEDSTETTPKTQDAVFQFGTPGYPDVGRPDGDPWNTNYDLTQCNFNIRTVDFDKNLEPFSPGYWRTVPDGEIGYKDAVAPRLVLTGTPTEAVKLYVWSENEEAAYLADGELRDINVTATQVEQRHVLVIDTVSDYKADIGGYEFRLAGAEGGKGKAANIVLTAFTNFNYTTGALSPARVADYLSVPVMCGEKSPASVTVKPDRTAVTATANYTAAVSLLNLSFNKTYEADVDIEIVPGFNDDAISANWWDYIRFGVADGEDPTFETPTRNPVVRIPAGSRVPTCFVNEDGTEGDRIDNGKIFVFALRSDANTVMPHKMTFKVTTENAAAAAYFGGFDKVQSGFTIDAANPEILSPEEGETMNPAVAGANYELRLLVSDIYAGLHGDEGYDIFFASDITTEPLSQLPGVYTVGKNGYLYDKVSGGLPLVVYSTIDPSLNNSKVYVTSHVTGNNSAERNFKVNVTAPATMTIKAVNEAGEVIPNPQYIEGDDVSILITLDRKNGNQPVYAFLKPVSTKDAAAADCSFLAQENGVGIEIGPYGQTATGYFTLVDGCTTAAASQFSYKVELRNQPVYQDGEEVQTFKCANTMVLRSTNVIPTVTAVEMGLNVTDENGEFPGIVVPKDVVQTFHALVEEPGLADLRATGADAFKAKWIFSTAGTTPKGPIESPTTGVIEGDPDEKTASFSFPKAGRWTVTLQLKDKDMSKYGNGQLDKKFTFYVDVVDQPSITVKGYSGDAAEQSSFEETESGDFGGESYITVNLAFNKCEFETVVQLTVKAGGEENPGRFVLQESDYTRQTGADTYEITFPPGETSLPVAIKTLDGTQLSKQMGFSVVPKMLTEEIVPDSGDKPAKDYYVGVTKNLKVVNVAPYVDEADLTPTPGTNRIEAVIGDAEPISWDFTDVLPDFEGGIKVEVKGGGGHSETVYTADQAAGSFTPSFSTPGEQTVKLTITDKDKGSVSFVWYYNVAHTKVLRIVAHGPSGGNGTANSKRYRTASGLGAGRVYAQSASTGVAYFESSYNCGEDASNCKVYGYGYKVGEGWSDAAGGDSFRKYPERSEAIDAAGNTRSGATRGFSYDEFARRPENNYFDRKGNPVDSFLYTWLSLTRSAENSTLTDCIMGNAFAPEYTEMADSGTLAALVDPHTPTGANTANNTSSKLIYDDTLLEAIFSREWLATDNMGDINQDGIPDIYVDKYGLGVIDIQTGLLAEEGKDLENADGFNEDEDYLPALDTAVYDHLIPGLKGSWTARPFDAITEIRGYGEGLNDAAEQAGIPGVRPERVYEDPDLSPTSTLSKVEFLAWSEFAAANLPAGAVSNANYFSRWSPERPTDPTKADTDNDGIPDGYEYYFWYRAHVGYLDGGVHKYLTGRRYNPSNPGEGDFIASETIAAAMDPLVRANGTDADTVDTDNDGLPNALEFEIGTNPFDFDTDGDGLPDGWEVMISGTDPTTAYTTPGICDAMRNFDGDAMAFTTPKLESGVTPKPLKTLVPTTFALVQDGGMTDGIQWYAAETPLAEGAVKVEKTGIECTALTLTVDGKKRTYVTTKKLNEGEIFAKDADGKLTLAVDLLKDSTWEAVAKDAKELLELGLTVADDYVRLMPVNLLAGTPVDEAVAEIEVPPEEPAEEPAEEPTPTVRPVTCATLALADTVKGTQAAWVYGSVKVPTLTTGDTSANKGGFGMLALGKYLDAPKGKPLAALPKANEDVAYLHYLVYQQFKFDPRTAWNANSPLNARWGKSDSDDSGAKTDSKNDKTGYAGTATRTRAYTAYDEFLVFSFFYNNGMKTLMLEDLGDDAPYMAELWYANTTNPQGPHEPDLDVGGATSKSGSTGGEGGETASVAYWGRNSDNGADTDGDGVPDGWELYVMSGPKVKKDGKELFRFPMPYDNAPYSNFSPFVGEAKSSSATDNKDLSDGAAGDGDKLTEYQEFEGTDSIAYYAWANQLDKDGNKYAYSTTVVHDGTWTWFNKFFPSDPWNEDTDGDIVKDGDEKGSFNYADVDTGKVCVPGGGLNPCSVDTDQDGLPDGWERQFKGKTVYTEADCQFAKGVDAEGNEKTSEKQTLQGYMDGMDGTVADAFNYRHETSRDGNVSESFVLRLDGVDQVVDRDYDKDGLDNWQEYLVGAMRCWRYDDPLSSWDFVPKSAFYDEYGTFQMDRALAYTKLKDAATFWYETLFNKSGKWYNPHLVAGTGPSSQYFSRVTNGFDPNFTDAGSYYIFYDRLNGVLLKELWGGEMGVPLAPRKYVSCSPLRADTDHDGMDDGYELFHGMNPLLGESAVLETNGGACDIVFSAWYAETTGSPVNALANVWTDPNQYARWQERGLLKLAKNGQLRGSNGYDFAVRPWLNGLAAADPDGDDIRNQEEAIMPLVAPTTVWTHTDPTPLWMTDTSYDDSLVNRFFRLPTRYGRIDGGVPETIVGPDGNTYDLREADGFAYVKIMGADVPALMGFLPDHWKLAADLSSNWICSFEENEGFDSDHDAINDYEEIQGKVRSKTDPQDADSPRRRQAMYFPGKDAALQSMPFVQERYPVATVGYPDDPSFLQYTVECWAMPEAGEDGKVADATVIERACYVAPSHCADKKYVRCNFRLAIKDGKWYTKFDSDGTLASNPIEVFGATAAEAGTWFHVAATYDAEKLVLYVNGDQDGYEVTSVMPAYGSSAMVVYPGDGYTVSNGIVIVGEDGAGLGEPHHYWFNHKYSVHGFLVGASFKDDVDLQQPWELHLNVLNAQGWGYYKDFFRGYVDEIRVWDGARTAGDIYADYTARKRYTREDALENRSTVYNQWRQGKRRYEVLDDAVTVTPELRFHWTFDSVPGAENAAQVATSPHGFKNGEKAPWSRPEGYEISWWKNVIGGYGSVYAGDADWVTWIPSTVAHLPRYDATTLDSYYFAADFAGDIPGTYAFARTAEPVSRWNQYVRNGTSKDSEFCTTSRRFWLANNKGTNTTSSLDTLFAFTGRHLNQMGDDLLPLGGAFVRYVGTMWDDQGASSTWEHTGVDADNDGLPDWWQEYADQNYRPDDLDPRKTITWDTEIDYEIGGVTMRIKASEAYLRDLAKGVYADERGMGHPTSKERAAGEDKTVFEQTAKSDGLIPDWWKELYKIDGLEPLADTDNDGLNNYVEYVASELLPFRLRLDPKTAKSDTETLDYFCKVGKLYVGEMLTDHDQMEDHWERSLGGGKSADPTVWDALEDPDEDGWTNFAENRYNGYMMSNLAQLPSHAVGDNEVLDAPVPSVKLTVRYNGTHFSAASTQDGAQGGGAQGGAGQQPAADAADGIDVGRSDIPNLVVETFTQNSPSPRDAKFVLKPGETVNREVYLGGWENRVVRGTMSPGNIDVGSVNIKFAQVPQSDLYSWTDEQGLHLARPYAEFKEALDKNPDIIQNVQDFTWLELVAPVNEFTSSDRAVTVQREALTQTGYIAVYGQRVGTIDLTTGDFEFNMAAMMELQPNYTFSSSVAGAWSYKEAIFKLTYSSTVPSVQTKRFEVTLAQADEGFLRGGKNTILAFFDNDGNGSYTPGEPFGVLNDVEIGWAGRALELELTDMSGVTPRVDFWSAASDRATFVTGNDDTGVSAVIMRRTTRTETSSNVTEQVVTETTSSNEINGVTAPAARTVVTVSRYRIDGYDIATAGLYGLHNDVLEREFDQEVRSYLHEGDFLRDGALDIDWDHFYEEVTANRSVGRLGVDVTNVTYLATFDWSSSTYVDSRDSSNTVTALSTLITRRFEKTRTVPTPAPVSAVFTKAQPTFAWKILGENKWASKFGTTYTAFKVRVRNADGSVIYDSGVRRLPAKDAEGVYSWTPPLYVGSKTPQGALFANLANYTWEVALYNAKFSNDSVMSVDELSGNPFSARSAFRMNVTTTDTSSRAIAVGWDYSGPAKNLADRIRIQAFATPDFTGDPVAEATVNAARGTVVLKGLAEGSYFLRAYLDTNNNFVRDAWESWGYLNERDRANVSGIFNPVQAEAKFTVNEKVVRTIYLEDCDTDRDGFPDAWEAEQNGDKFDSGKIGPVTGDAELIGVNPQLKSNLMQQDVLGELSPAFATALNSPAGVALMTGIKPADVSMAAAGGFEVKSEVDPETLTIVGFSVDAAQNRVLLKVGAETTADVDAAVANFLNITVKKGAEVTVKVEYAETPTGPWTVVTGVNGTVTVDRTGTDIPVELEGELPAQGYFRAVIEE